MSHCAECCFGSGVEADPDCPQHGLPAAQPEALTEGPCERTTVEVCGFHGLDWPCAAQPEAREELVCICGHPGLTFDGFDPECPTHGRDAPTAQAAAGEVRPVEDVTDLDGGEAREEQDAVRCGARVPTPHPRISQECVLPPAHNGRHAARPDAPTAEEPRRG